MFQESSEVVSFLRDSRATNPAPLQTSLFHPEEERLPVRTWAYARDAESTFDVSLKNVNIYHLVSRDVNVLNPVKCSG